MSFEMKDMSGNAFKNKRKEKDTHADYTGEVKINGVIYWLSVWIKKDKNGNTYFSHSYKKKDLKPAYEAAEKVKVEVKKFPAPVDDDDFNQQIPF